MSNGMETMRKDAERYRKLREIAITNGVLAATIEIEQLDFFKREEDFDRCVDGIEVEVESA